MIKQRNGWIIVGLKELSSSKKKRTLDISNPGAVHSTKI